jgi:hypothetical protein
MGKRNTKIWKFAVALYMAYSVSADIILIGGIIYLIFGA